MEASDRTADGRYILASGRRWRASDPRIPEGVRKRLVSHLMSARRAVGAARRSGDATAERAARDRVQRAKTGLGERGTAWWELSEGERRARWEEALRTLDAEGGSGGG